MIILIGGASHTGKTYLAQRLLERYNMPYLSLDHLKMGLIRGKIACGFLVTDKDADIAPLLWPVVEGIIRTAIENRQHMIIEGCYLPHESVKKLLEEFPNDIVEGYICFTDRYIHKHFEDVILENRNVIEKRMYVDDRPAEAFIEDHHTIRNGCQMHHLKYVDIDEDYETEMQAIVDWFDCKLHGEATDE